MDRKVIKMNTITLVLCYESDSVYIQFLFWFVSRSE